MRSAARCFFCNIVAFTLSLAFLAGPLSSVAVADSEAENLVLLDRYSKAIAALVKKAAPAVVNVRVEKTGKSPRQQDPTDFFNDPFFEHFFGPQFRDRRRSPREFKQEGQGSGFIIRTDGTILTNNHVVEGADRIIVRLADKREFKAKVLGADPQSDVAVIRIEDKVELPVVLLGDSDKLEVGELVVAIGSPFALSQTVTQGVVSAKGRSRMGINEYEDFIQTDAAINPGNSGGPLLNTRGEVVGMNTAIFSRSGGYMGIGFAIPVNMAKTILPQLEKSGKVTRGWLGVAIQDVDEELARSFNLDKARGALVSEVSEDSPAHKAGLRQGDVIVAVAGDVVNDVAELRNRISLTPPGTKVPLRVLRDGKQMEISAVIGELTADKAVAAAKSGNGQTGLEPMGLVLQDLTEELAQQFGFKQGQGVLIAEVTPNSPASRVGLQSGYLIEEVNKKAVKNLNDVVQAVKKSGKVKQVLLRVRAGDHSRYVALSVE
ncbi:MAG: serine protease [Desulfobulbaceae bacterium A2]|nr:MAG: serine protease [Desulfobulbaceae bacterium A2]